MNPHIKPVATKVFDECGRVIDNVEDLEDDMEIWLSYGEAWIDPNSESFALGLRALGVGCMTCPLFDVGLYNF